MGYLKKTVNPKSLKNLDPHNRLLGVVPKKRINIMIDPEHYQILQQTGNISQTISKLIEADLMESRRGLLDALREVLAKVKNKEKGFKVNACGGLLQALRHIEENYLTNRTELD